MPSLTRHYLRNQIHCFPSVLLVAEVDWVGRMGSHSEPRWQRPSLDMKDLHLLYQALLVTACWETLIEVGSFSLSLVSRLAVDSAEAEYMALVLILGTHTCDKYKFVSVHLF